VSLIRRLTIVACVLLGISAMCVDAWAQSAVDTMRLALTPPDSVYARRDGRNIVLGWYPPRADLGSVTGSRDFSNWYGSNPLISHVDISGIYTGTIDQTLKVGKVVLGTTVSVDTIGPGGEASIKLYAEVRNRRDYYYWEFNVGSDFYTPGTPIPLKLIGQQTHDTLGLGVSVAFGAGVIDSTSLGNPPYFEIDLQTFEGFHVWRGLSPLPSHMIVVSDLSRDDAFVGVEQDSLYFLQWPKKDGQGRSYFEYVDTDVYVGFTYYYLVTCFDKGYFKGRSQHNKTDNFVCNEDDPPACEDAGTVITMSVDPGANNLMGRIYAVPNPYRTGTSAETSPFYHNFPDGSIKFFNVPPDAELKIFTVSGDLVWEVGPTGDNGVVSWDVKNKHDGDVGSGVYIYRCEGSDGSAMYGRIVVIR
jgi:hypothetical protein